VPSRAARRPAGFSGAAPGSLSLWHPVYLGRPLPPLWHGPLPCVVGPSGPNCPEADARLLCLRRVGGRAPREGGPPGSFRLPGGGAHSPKPPLVHALRGGQARQSLGGTPHCVPAGGGRSSVNDRAEVYCTYGTVVLAAYPLFDNVHLSLAIVFIRRVKSLTASSKKIVIQFCLTQNVRNTILLTSNCPVYLFINCNYLWRCIYVFIFWVSIYL